MKQGKRKKMKEVVVLPSSAFSNISIWDIPIPVESK